MTAFCLFGAPSARSAPDDVFLDVEIKPPRDVLLAVVDRIEDRPFRFGRVLLLGGQRPVGHIDERNADPRAVTARYLPLVARDGSNARRVSLDALARGRETVCGRRA